MSLLKRVYKLFFTEAEEKPDGHFPIVKSIDYINAFPKKLDEEVLAVSELFDGIDGLNTAERRTAQKARNTGCERYIGIGYVRYSTPHR